MTPGEIPGKDAFRKSRNIDVTATRLVDFDLTFSIFVLL
jgi:hypothetical protein